MQKNIFLVLMTLMIIGCAPACKKACGVNCLHGGTCAGNICACPDPYSGYNCDTQCILGYEGYMCQTLSREKFIGTWTCTSTDQSGRSSTYLITFGNNGYELFMNLNNFNNNSSYPIICTMVGKNSFSIDQSQQVAQGTAAGISGSGIYRDGRWVINISENNNMNFFANATRQN